LTKRSISIRDLRATDRGLTKCGDWIAFQCIFGQLVSAFYYGGREMLA